MKFQPDRLDGVNTISRHGLVDGQSVVWVDGMRHDSSLVVPWHGTVQAWPVPTLQALTAEHFEALLAFEPELIIFGSGARLRFVAPALLRGLMQRRIGIETMDTAAACRTYNVLASEGRAVVAALLLEAPAQAQAL